MSVNIRLKHSSVDGKEPLPSDLVEGELALNVNENSPAAYIKDSAGNVVKLAGSGSVGSNDQWTRTGTELAPTNAGDDVFTSGDVKVGGTTGTPNIELKGSDGSAKFGPRVDVEGIVVANDGPEFAYLRNDSIVWTESTFSLGSTTRGVIAAFQDNGDVLVGTNPNNPKIRLAGGTGAAEFDDVVKIGGTLPASPNISLNADGNAEFAGTSTFGSTTSQIIDPTSTDLGSLVSANGGHWQVFDLADSSNATHLYNVRSGTKTLVQATKGSGALFIGGDVAGGNPNTLLASDGSATFEGKVTTASTEDADPGATVVTKDYLSSAGSGSGDFGYWNRTGTTLSPVNNGDEVFCILNNSSDFYNVSQTTATELTAASGLSINNSDSTTEGTGEYLYFTGRGTNPNTHQAWLGTSCKDNFAGPTLEYWAKNQGTSLVNKRFTVSSGGTFNIGGTLPSSPKHQPECRRQRCVCWERRYWRYEPCRKAKY